MFWPLDAKSLKKPWCWERLRAGGEGGSRGWASWMAYRLSGREFEQTPGESGGQRSLVCCSPWGHKELDTTEQPNNNCKNWCISNALTRGERLYSFSEPFLVVLTMLQLIRHVITFIHWTLTECFLFWVLGLMGCPPRVQFCARGVFYANNFILSHYWVHCDTTD